MNRRHRSFVKHCFHRLNSCCVKMTKSCCYGMTSYFWRLIYYSEKMNSAVSKNLSVNKNYREKNCCYCDMLRDLPYRQNFSDKKTNQKHCCECCLACCKKNLFLPRDECKHSHYVNLPTDRLICFLRYESDKSFFPDEPNSNCLNRKLLFPNWNLYEQPNDNYLNWCVRLHCVLHRNCC